MNHRVKGLLIAVLQVGLVATLGGKLLYDRATLPRVWVQAAPYDPDMPIRGRYVSLQLQVKARGIEEGKVKSPGYQVPQGVVLKVENGELVAEPKRETMCDRSALQVHFIERRGEKLAVLNQPIPFFIPEHIPDPSRRQPGEELWVEVTIPKKGPPRPIRLGVKKGTNSIIPVVIG